MREIKFRGKAIMSIEELELMNIEHDNGWVYGNLIKNGSRPMITADILEEIDESIYPEWWAVVEPKSVGQYTGLKDKNGKEIYEGDIVKWTRVTFKDCSRTTVEKTEEIIGEVYWAETMWAIRRNGVGYLLMPYFVKSDEFEVIYENPELLEDEE